MEGQEQALENALWVAYRTLRDRLAMLEQNGARSEPGGVDSKLPSVNKKIEETQQHLELLRTILLGNS